MDWKALTRIIVIICLALSTCFLAYIKAITGNQAELLLFAIGGWGFGYLANGAKNKITGI